MTSAGTSDEQLLRRFAGGQRDALGELARRYESALLGLAAGLLGGRRELACDAVQETWLRVIRFAGQFNGDSGVKTWLYRILINQCHSLRGARPTTAAEGMSDVAGSQASPESRAAATDTNHALERAVEQLGEDQRRVVLLCYHAGMTHGQAAEILEIPLGTLKSRLHAALESLRAKLPAEGV